MYTHIHTPIKCTYGGETLRGKDEHGVNEFCCEEEKKDFILKSRNVLIDKKVSM